MKNSSWKPALPPFRKYKKEIFERVIATSVFIYQIGESEALRKASNPVFLPEITTEVFQKKVAYLKRCILRYRKLTGVGRGITAVQVGIPERLSVIYMPEIRGKLLIIINPKITAKSKKLLRYPEICMSANPIISPVVRPAWIEFEYYDEKGRRQYWDKKDTTKERRMYNRVFQHEIDHMEGIVNIDLVNSKELIFESDPKFYDRADFIEVIRRGEKYEKARFEKV